MPTQKLNTRAFLKAIQDKSTVKGFTHDFYNYPARFSPLFVREAINIFSNPGDLIVDPFAGGGTTLVEARLLNRHCIGLDISSLATFITNTKITRLTNEEIDAVRLWSLNKIETLSPYFSIDNITAWKKKGYQKNISSISTWPIKNTIEHFLQLLKASRLSKKQKNLVRCTILKTGQWAFDNKKEIPSTEQFRNKLEENIYSLSDGAKQFSLNTSENISSPVSICFNKPASEINKIDALKELGTPKLVLTSPPYPGVHVVYHRWQVQGRKETPAPFWIANSLDGHGLSHYAMGGRHEKGLETYYSNILKSFSAIKEVCSKETLIVQMLAFSNIEWQLPKYLEVMNLAGFLEVNIGNDRIWRNVPNRKWYADTKGKTDSSNEVVLFHKLLS